MYLIRLCRTIPGLGKRCQIIVLDTERRVALRQESIPFTEALESVIDASAGDLMVERSPCPPKTALAVLSSLARRLRPHRERN